jgi:hypothetical protein
MPYDPPAAVRKDPLKQSKRAMKYMALPLLKHCFSLDLNINFLLHIYYLISTGELCGSAI